MGSNLFVIKRATTEATEKDAFHAKLLSMSTLPDWSALLAPLVEKGKGEPLGATRFFALITLDSGARIGLDQTGRFVLVREEDPQLVAFSIEDAYFFHEVVESRRRSFDEAVEESAKGLGLPAIEVSLAFPAVEIVRAVLLKNMHYTTRLALGWLHPSELRDVRDEIKRIATDRYTPTSLRDFAERLIVPS